MEKRREATYGESVNDPPIKGPTTEDRPNVTPKKDVYIGLLWRGIMRTVIMMAPVPMPAAPIPAIARPTMTEKTEISKLLITQLVKT